jgi:hypothetical protein
MSETSLVSAKNINSKGEAQEPVWIKNDYKAALEKRGGKTSPFL